MDGFLAINDSVGIGKVYNNIGTVWYYLTNYDKCLEYYNLSDRIFRQLNDEIGIANVNIGLGNYYLESEQNPELSLEKFKESLEVYKSHGNIRMEMITLNNLGNVYSIELNKLKKNNLLDKQKALKHYKRALTIAKSLPDSFQLGGISMNIATTFDEISTDSSDLYYNKSLKIYEALENSFKIGMVHMNRGFSLLKAEDWNASIVQNRKAQKLGFQVNSWDIIAGSSINLATAFDELNLADSALKYHKIHTIYHDSLYNEDKQQIIENLKISYETEKKDQQLKLNEATILIKTTENRTLMLILFIVAGCAIVVILFNQKRLKDQKILRRKDQELRERETVLREKDQELHQQQVDQMVRDQELKSINAMLEGEEKERKRIAEDLHDRVGSMLSAMKLQTDTSDTKLTSLLDETVDEVRRISHNLETKVLNKFGLIAALEDLADKIKGSEKINFELQYLDLTERLENKVEINAYRIVQELISNALKHSRATEIVTQVNRIEDQLIITVEDDGVGFNSLKVKESSSGMGLRNVMSRAHELNGHFNVDSGKGQGTMITVEFPI
ncbi:MAG: sensor histidine kinase [Cytophagales bacterium]|nr:sensor histidine kinase [Cytophagales bacterium]